MLLTYVSSQHGRFCERPHRTEARLFHFFHVTLKNLFLLTRSAMLKQSFTSYFLFFFSGPKSLHNPLHKKRPFVRTLYWLLILLLSKYHLIFQFLSNLILSYNMIISAYLVLLLTFISTCLLFYTSILPLFLIGHD